jgi:hypothetical protein
MAILKRTFYSNAVHTEYLMVNTRTSYISYAAITKTLKGKGHPDALLAPRVHQHVPMHKAQVNSLGCARNDNETH